MKIKTSKLTGVALDWAVVVAETNNPYLPHKIPNYSTYWAQGGPIVERTGIGHKYAGELGFVAWLSRGIGHHKDESSQFGPTPLIAAMRCYVASKLGYEVDVPDELL